MYQDLKWLLGIIEENKNTVESISAKNYENLVKTLKEENFIKSDSINKKIAQWNKEHNHLKEELEVYIKHVILVVKWLILMFEFTKNGNNTLI